MTDLSQRVLTHGGRGRRAPVPSTWPSSMGVQGKARSENAPCAFRTPTELEELRDDPYAIDRHRSEKLQFADTAAPWVWSAVQMRRTQTHGAVMAIIIARPTDISMQRKGHSKRRS